MARGTYCDGFRAAKKLDDSIGMTADRVWHSGVVKHLKGKSVAYAEGWLGYVHTKQGYRGRTRGCLRKGRKS
jgi:hypothetical protein